MRQQNRNHNSKYRLQCSRNCNNFLYGIAKSLNVIIPIQNLWNKIQNRKMHLHCNQKTHHIIDQFIKHSTHIIPKAKMKYQAEYFLLMTTTLKTSSCTL